MSGYDADKIGRGYLDHLTDADLRLLAGRDADALRTRPAAVLARLDQPAVFDTVFATSPASHDFFAFASPFLTFALALHRTAAELTDKAYVPEWTGPRQRLPVFDGGRLSGFLADLRHRLFLAELLASYAHVSGGSYWTRTPRGWRRRRWSELDPVRLAGLLEVLPPPERPGLYRRLGDLALFLTGVFPDHTAAHAFGAVDAARLLRSVGVRPERGPQAGHVQLMGWLGARWYRQAVESALVPTERLLELTDIAELFDDARRVLNVVADRYLFVHGNPWFPLPWN